MLRKRFLETVASYGMDRLMAEKGIVIACFSGGADSALLVRFLAEYTSERGIRLVLAHVNHGIRGEESDADEAFVRHTARELGLELYVKRISVPDIARASGIGTEEAARNVRYAFFEELSESLGGAAAATAHNGDDHLETVLFRMMRGSGLRGLCGISPVRGIYFRPMLAMSGEEIRSYCREKDIAYRTDSTNADTVYTRNYIRHRILPELKALSDPPHRPILRMTEALRTDSDYLETEAIRQCSAGTTTFGRGALLALHPALSGRILRNMAVDFGCPVPESVHIRDVIGLAASDKREGSISIPGGRFHVTRESVSVCSAEEMSAEVERFPMEPFAEDGCAVFENERYKVLLSQNKHMTSTEEYENIYKLSIHKILCSDKIIGSLYMKYREQGDTYKVGGMTRKIRKLMIEQKLTADEKASYPLLCDDSGILWMPRYPLRDGAEAKEDGKPVLHLFFFEKNDKINNGGIYDTQGSIGEGH